MRENYVFAKAYRAYLQSPNRENAENVYESIDDISYLGKLEAIAIGGEMAISAVNNANIPGYDKEFMVSESEEDLLEAIQLRQDDARLHLFLMNFYFNTGSVNSGNLDKILELRDEAIRLSPTRAVTYLLSGRTHMAKKEYEMGVREFEKAAELAPWVLEPHINLFAAYVTVGNSEGALSERKNIQEMLSRPSLEEGWKVNTYKRMAQIYLQFNDYEGAEEVLWEGIALVRTSSELYATLANVYAMQGKNDEARDAATKAADIDPSFKEAAEEFIKLLDEGKLKKS